MVQVSTYQNFPRTTEAAFTFGAPVSPSKHFVQLLSNLLAATIAAFVVSLMVAPYWKRVLAISLLGGFACLSVSTIYWNWYGFPNSFFMAQIVDQLVGWLLAGLVIAKMVPPPERPNELPASVQGMDRTETAP